MLRIEKRGEIHEKAISYSLFNNKYDRKCDRRTACRTPNR